MRLTYVLVAALAALATLTPIAVLVDAFIGVPNLEHEIRCPACVAFAVALRRASWESHPVFDVRERLKRRKLLNSDQRCMDVLTEAMDILLTKMHYVFYKEPLPPPPHHEQALLFTNKSHAPAGSSCRFWSLQDLYLHRRLQVAEFRQIREVQERNSDESLMHFLHNEIREALGDEAEALCYLDLYHTKNHTEDDYFVAPQGEGNLEHLTALGRWMDPEGISGSEETWLHLNILKDREMDSAETMPWIVKLCKDKSMCGADAKKSRLPFEEYVRGLLPVVPPYVEAKQLAASDAGEDSDEEKPLVNEDF